MAAANQPTTGRPWLLRLASQARIDPPQPEPSPPAVRPSAPPPPPPPRGPPIRQASLALGRSPLVALPAPTAQPPPAALRQTAPPPASANAVTSPAEAPRSARGVSPAPPAASANGNGAVIAPTVVPRSARSPSPALPPPPPAASTNGTAIAATPLEAQRSARAPSPGFGYSDRQPEPNSQAIAAGKDNSNGNKVLGNGAFNGGNSFKQLNDEKISATDGRGWAPAKAKKEMTGVTIAGHNVGSFMDLGASYSHQIRRQQYQPADGKTQFEDIKKSNATAAEFEAEGGGRKLKPWFSMVNSNVQTVNNSMLLNTACVQGSPGVHINVGGGRSGRQLKNGGYFSDQKKPSSSPSSPS